MQIQLNIQSKTLAKLLRFPIFVVLWLLLSACVLAVLSQGHEAHADDADIRLVIDISGSMKRNDPQNLRQPAVNLLMELLPDGSRAGVWTFGKEVNMLVPFGTVDIKWREMATQKAAEINSVGLYTNIGGALEKATVIDSHVNSKAHIILLTDGMVDINKDPQKNQKEWRRIVDEILPLVKDQGFVIHTVALSENADTQLMKKLSLVTNGSATTAKTAEELMPAFLKAFDSAAPSQQLPLLGNHFVVDSSVEEFTALMFRDDPVESLVLKGPDGIAVNFEALSEDISWHHTNTYDLVTVTRPLEGEWQVEGTLAKGSRITVVSDLNLRVKPLPINTSIGGVLELQFALQEDNKVITRKDFLQILTINASSTLQSQNKLSWSYAFDTQEPPNNGVFSTSLEGFGEPGEYVVSVALDGKSFQRGYSHQLLVRLPFEAEIVKGYNDNSQRLYRVIIQKNAEHIQAKNIQMAITVVSPDRRRQVQPLEINERDIWEYSILPQQEGLYTLDVKITGVDDHGTAFEYSLVPLQFKYEPTEDFENLLVNPEETAAVSVESSAAASSSAPTVAADLEPEIEDSATPWILYAGLAAGNILLLGLGFFAFKKIIGVNSDDEAAPETELPAMDAGDDSKSESTDAELEDPGAMEMDEIDDEIPPMEDLEPDMNFEEDDIDESEPEPEPVKVEPKAERIDEDFDFDLSALDSDDGAETEDNPTSDKENISKDGDTGGNADQDDMAQAMLKAQGLDLAEDELDDAISNLIDELDDDSGNNDKKREKPSNMAGEINLDDFDFDEDDD